MVCREDRLVLAPGRTRSWPGRAVAERLSLQAARHEGALLVHDVIRPEPDHAAEAVHDGRDDSVAVERALDVLT
jgi:hypothetical protein